MKTAFSSWNNRIAPVFDVARQVILVHAELGRIVSEAEEALPGDDLSGKARHLADFQVKTLVCGAISRPMQDLVASYGISVIPFVAGDLREVIRAWLEERIHDEIFAMPGCCQQGRRNGSRGLGLEAGRVRCGKGNTHEAGACGICICPQCSHREPHERGVVCSRKQCPVCGSPMIRAQGRRGIRIKEDQRP